MPPTDQPPSYLFQSIVGMFVVLFVLQFLDMHSTLTASVAQHESNRLIQWIAQTVGFVSTVVLVKFIDAFVVFGLFCYWRKHRDGDREFLITLCILVVVYSAVVIGNYFGK